MRPSQPNCGGPSVTLSTWTPLVTITLRTTTSQRFRESRGSPAVYWQVKEKKEKDDDGCGKSSEIFSRWTIPHLHTGILYSLENLFGKYLEKGAMLEKRGLPSIRDPDSPTTNTNRYVLADITSFFTLLVGIYFPSVTGERKSGLNVIHQQCWNSSTSFQMIVFLIFMICVLNVWDHSQHKCRSETELASSRCTKWILWHRYLIYKWCLRWTVLTVTWLLEE